MKQEKLGKMCLINIFKVKSAMKYQKHICSHNGTTLRKLITCGIREGKREDSMKVGNRDALRGDKIKFYDACVLALVMILLFIVKAIHSVYAVDETAWRLLKSTQNILRQCRLETQVINET